MSRCQHRWVDFGSSVRVCQDCGAQEALGHSYPASPAMARWARDALQRQREETTT